MKSLALQDDEGAWRYWTGEPRPQIGIADDLFQIPANAADTYSWQKLRTFGLYLVTSDAVPEGKVVVSSELVDIDGKPHESLTLADAPAPEVMPYQLYKSTFIERMTPTEAAVLEGVLNAEEAKLRMMFHAVEYFMSDDPLFAVLHWVITQELGVTRADDLLISEA